MYYVIYNVYLQNNQICLERKLDSTKKMRLSQAAARDGQTYDITYGNPSSGSEIICRYSRMKMVFKAITSSIPL